MKAARQALSRAVAKGTPIVEQPTLACLRERADRAETEFNTVCLKYYPDGKWGGYRAIECDTAPKDVIAAMEIYHAATHAFYSARDGENGFLGFAKSRGAP